MNYILVLNISIKGILNLCACAKILYVIICTNAYCCRKIVYLILYMYLNLVKP